MKKYLGVTLGIMTAFGGFLDLGQIVFTAQAGAYFGYRLLWAIILGTAAIILYMEMCGRIAVVANEPVFSVVRTNLGFRFGLFVLIASNLLNLITCAAELAGVAIVLHLLTEWPEKTLLVASTFILGATVHFLRFQWIERIFGLSGLLMIIFAVSTVVLHPDWSQIASGLLPHLTISSRKDSLLYGYYSVGIFSALLMVYEVHFYSSGAIEEDWTPADLKQNFMVASFGSVFGSLLTVALMAVAVLVLLPRGIFPELLSTAILAGAFPFGKEALIVTLLGTLACIAGAAVETNLSGAYNLCQFFYLSWGKNRPIGEVPAYSAYWMGTLALACVIALTGISPLDLVNVSIIFGMVIMPLTYYPILRVAADKDIMGKHVNSRSLTITGAIFLIAITVAAIAAIPLMIVTHGGRP
jgi:Mn2+/Fe2+ NRAMP family transporter